MDDQISNYVFAGGCYHGSDDGDVVRQLDSGDNSLPVMRLSLHESWPP